MATTTDQNQRTAAPWTDFEVRFFVGADRLLGNVELTAGSTYDPDASTTLSADLPFDEEDTITVVSTTGFSTGFLVVHPYAAGESFELISYTGTTSTTFTGLTRIEPVGDRRNHSSGATVSEWKEVTEYLYGAVTLDLQQDDEIADWTAKIQGVNYASTLFQPDRAFLCMWRFRPSSGSMSSWTTWTVGFMGWLQDVNVDGDWTERNKWSSNVVSLAYYLDKTDVGSGTTYGKEDLAEGKSVTTSSVLLDVYQEEGTGEFVGLPDLGGENITDGEMSTLWISDGEPNPSQETPVNKYHGCINEVYLRPETWMPSGLQWIELFYQDDEAMPPNGFQHAFLVTDDTDWVWTGWDPDGRHPSMNYLDLPATATPSIGDPVFVVFTNDKPAFMAHFPTCQSDVYDWRALQVGTFSPDPTGDLIALMFWGVMCSDVVWWDGGRASWALHDFTGNSTGYYDPGGTNHSGWTGDMIPTPPIGHSFRADPTGNAGGNDTYYIADEDHPTPGHAISATPEWFYVDLGELGITLTTELSSGETTAAYLDGNLGLTDTGDVVIDTEVIGYASIDRINNKLLTLTRGGTPATHPVGTTVRQYEGGSATNIHRIESIKWRRRPVMITPPLYHIPQAFDVYSSIYDTGFCLPTDTEWDDGPGSGGWEDYWDRIASVRAYNSTAWQKTLTTPLRARVVLLSILKMKGLGRAKMNEFSVFPDTGTVVWDDENQSSWGAGWSTKIIAHLLNEWLGIDTSLITEDALGRQVSKMDVTKDRISKAVRDICKSAMTIAEFSLDNTVTIRWNTLFGAGGWPDVYFYWTRSNARTIRFSRKTQHSVAQVNVKLTNAEDEETYEASFPAEPLTIGDVIDREDSLIIGDEDDAKTIAEATYHALQLTDTATIVPKGIAEWALPGQRHVITYGVDEDETYLNGHNVIITGVTHRIRMPDSEGRRKSWDTSITAKRVEYV